MEIKQILVPVDFSEYSDRAVDFALTLAEKLNAAITLFHVIVMFSEDVDEARRLKEYEQVVRAREKWIQERLKAHRMEADERGIAVKSEVRRGFSPADEILEFLAEKDFDLVVMGTHGRTGIKHLIHGSVTERVVRLSPVPVLTVHHAQHEFNPKHILVPIDFSRHSLKAVDYAALLAQQFQAQVTFLHVIEEMIHPAFYAAHMESLFQLDPQLKTRALERLQSFVNRSDLNAQYMVLEGKPYKEILEFANQHNVDLIVMATRGLTGLDYILLGSTAERVVRLAQCAVLTVGHVEEENQE